MSYYYRRSSGGFRWTPTWLLIMVNMLFFIITGMAGLKGYSLISLLGLRTVGLLDRPWTILTSIFMHASFWHLFGNMITLYFFGSYLLQLVGQRRFLIVYFIGGLMGNIFFILLASPFSLVVGASGALFALGGALAIMRPKTPVFIFPIPIPIPLIGAVMGGFVIVSFLPNVAWEAHLGGMVTGLIAGYIFRRQERRYR